jgi:hypothetical protein
VTRLDDVLHGADAGDIRAIQREILDKGGCLDDPAWVPFAAAMRIKLEMQRVLPETIRAASENASREAACRFLTTVESQAGPALRDLVQKAARTPVRESTRRATWLVASMCMGAAFLGGLIVAMSGGSLLRELGWISPPGLSVTDFDRLSWARRFDDPARRGAAEWSIAAGLQNPDVRTAIGWLFERQLTDPNRRDNAEWGMSRPGLFARRFLGENDFLVKGECPSQAVDRATGKRTCTVWYVPFRP